MILSNLPTGNILYDCFINLSGSKLLLKEELPLPVELRFQLLIIHFQPRGGSDNLPCRYWLSGGVVVGIGGGFLRLVRG